MVEYTGVVHHDHAQSKGDDRQDGKDIISSESPDSYGPRADGKSQQEDSHTNAVERPQFSEELPCVSVP